jgi:DNA-binding NarL/FixJ family response regulator
LVNTLPKLARVLLADDHAAMLAQTINRLTGTFEVVGSVGNGLDLIKAVAQLDPDVVVLDITMPGMDGIEAALKLQRAGCRAKLVFLTVHDDPDYMRAALQAGGVAYVAKSRLASDLVTAIHEAVAGRCFVSPNISLEENKAHGQRP